MHGASVASTLSNVHMKLASNSLLLDLGPSADVNRACPSVHPSVRLSMLAASTLLAQLTHTRMDSTIKQCHANPHKYTLSKINLIQTTMLG